MGLHVTPEQLRELLDKGAILGPAVQIVTAALNEPVSAAIQAPKTPGPRTGVTEDEFNRQVIDLARGRGWLVAHFRPGMTKKGKWVTAVRGDGAGFPDLVLVRNKVVFAELKVGNNKLSPNQRRWKKAFCAAGALWYEWRPADWPEIEEVLK